MVSNVGSKLPSSCSLFSIQHQSSTVPGPVLRTQCSHTGHSVVPQQKNNSKSKHASLLFPCAHSSLCLDESYSAGPRVPTASCTVETVTASLKSRPQHGGESEAHGGHALSSSCHSPIRVHSSLPCEQEGLGRLTNMMQPACVSAADCRTQATPGSWLYR